MKNDKIPHMLEEGLKHIAQAGYQHVYGEIIEEYGEKLKQDFISQMTDKLEAYVSILSEPTLTDMGITLKIEIDVKGVDVT